LELLAGVIAIETRAAEVTVKFVLPLTPVPGCVAEMVVLPLATLVASPLLPAALLIVATLVVPEDHVTALVRSCTELSVYVPVAVNDCARPRATVALAGVTSIETNVAELTEKLVLAEIPEPAWVAVIVVVPVLALVARPLVSAALLIVATLVLEEDQVTEVVRFWTELSV